MGDWDGAELQVLINDAGQYSLFPLPLAVPQGWREAGFRGSEQACIEFVDENWKDMLLKPGPE